MKLRDGLLVVLAPALIGLTAGAFTKISRTVEACATPEATIRAAEAPPEPDAPVELPKVTPRTEISAESMDAAIAAYLSAGPQDRDAMMAYTSFVAGLSLEDIGLMLERIGRIEGAEGLMYTLGHVLARWTELNPKEAAAYALTIPGQLQQPCLSVVMGRWVEKDPVAAYSWLAATGLAETERRNALANLIGGWARNDIVAASNYIINRPAGTRATQEVVSILGHRLTTEGPLLTAEWLKSVQASYPEAYPEFRDMYARMLSTSDPGAAMNYLVESGTDNRELVELIAGRMADKGIQMALEQVSALPEGTLRQQAQAGVMDRWARQDPDASGAWLESQLDQPGSNQLIASYARGISGKRMEDALAWAQRVKDPEEAHDLLIEVAQAWHAFNPAAAMRWMDQQDLSLDDKLRIVNFSIQDFNERARPASSAFYRSSRSPYTYP